MKRILLIVCFLSWFEVLAQTQTQLEWDFDKITTTEILKPLTRKGLPTPELIRQYTIASRDSSSKGQIFGAFHKSVRGVKGQALQLDGNTSYVDVNLTKGFSGEFSVGAWVALGAYPTNWCPLADQNLESEKGFFLGIDAYGQAGFKAYVGGKLVEIQSESKIPLREWTYIQGVYSQKEGLKLYLNDAIVASTKTTGAFMPATTSQLLIGKSTYRRKPEGTVRPNATEAVYAFLDGLVDELKIVGRALTKEEIHTYYNSIKSDVTPELAIRTLPLTGAKPGKFGAVYTKLPYYESWDKMWPVGAQADVVVNFGKNAGKFVFWRGTSYIPHWITENGIWYNNEFLETWSDKGSHEPMSDKRCQFSHVRILESSDARTVVHWRYALIDNWNEMARVDSLTGFGEWADEIYTIYPDEIGVRKITLHSSQPQSAHEWFEGILVMGPGQRPEQVLEPGALTLANMKGETHTYSWEKGIPKEADKYGYVALPANANIHLINTKSVLKPFTIISPKANPIWDIYHGELRKEVSMFPWWNHWPAAQKASDGRYAMDADYASHSSLTHANWDPYKLTENSHTKIMLHGLSDGNLPELISLTKSWSEPARLLLADRNSFSGGEYDPSERAYLINCKVDDFASNLNFSLEANESSPLENVALVIKNWGTRGVSIRIDDELVGRGKSFRYGLRDGMEGTDLIVWIEKKSVKLVKISLLPEENY